MEVPSSSPSRDIELPEITGPSPVSPQHAQPTSPRAPRNVGVPIPQTDLEQRQVTPASRPRRMSDPEEIAALIQQFHDEGKAWKVVMPGRDPKTVLPPGVEIIILDPSIGFKIKGRKSARQKAALDILAEVSARTAQINIPCSIHIPGNRTTPAGQSTQADFRQRLRAAITEVGPPSVQLFVDATSPKFTNLRLVSSHGDEAGANALLIKRDGSVERHEEPVDRLREKMRTGNYRCAFVREDLLPADPPPTESPDGSPPSDPSGITASSNPQRTAAASASRAQNDQVNHQTLQHFGLELKPVKGDGNCFYEAGRLTTQYATAKDFRADLKGYVEKDISAIRLQLSKIGMIPLDLDKVLVRLSGDGSQGSAYWGELDEARLLAWVSTRPVVVIEPSSPNRAAVLHPDLTTSYATNADELKLALENPIYLVHNGSNHWDAATAIPQKSK